MTITTDDHRTRKDFEACRKACVAVRVYLGLLREITGAGLGNLPCDESMRAIHECAEKRAEREPALDAAKTKALQSLAEADFLLHSLVSVDGVICSGDLETIIEPYEVWNLGDAREKVTS